MSNVTTIRSDLFNAPEGSILIHACNCKGRWGSGIALAFAKKFPKARDEYAKVCQEKGSSLRGTCLILNTSKYDIGCVFTSRGYAGTLDSEQQILEATRTAIADLIRQNVQNKPMHMCKINSGLFRVDWNKTKKILKEFEPHQFIVHSLD